MDPSEQWLLLENEVPPIEWLINNGRHYCLTFYDVLDTISTYQPLFVQKSQVICPVIAQLISRGTKIQIQVFQSEVCVLSTMPHLCPQEKTNCHQIYGKLGELNTGNNIGNGNSGQWEMEGKENIVRRGEPGEDAKICLTALLTLANSS